MAFSVPSFPLTANVFSPPWPGVFRLATPCNLGMGRRVNHPTDGGFGGPPSILTIVNTILVPALTDIRDYCNLAGQDFVEVPAGSNRFYIVQSVDDVGKGFPNEYRIVQIGKVRDGADGAGTYPGYFWPTPIP